MSDLSFLFVIIGVLAIGQIAMAVYLAGSVKFFALGRDSCVLSDIEGERAQLRSPSDCKISPTPALFFR